jgi:hypothetical protein
MELKGQVCSSVSVIGILTPYLSAYFSLWEIVIVAPGGLSVNEKGPIPLTAVPCYQPWLH